MNYFFSIRPHIFIYTNSHDSDKKRILEQRGATVVVLPNSAAFEASGKVDLRLMLQDLAKREINELHVEAGATLNGALIEALARCARNAGRDIASPAEARARLGLRATA